MMVAAFQSSKEMLLVLGACGGVGLSLLIMRNPRWGLLLTACAIPMETAGRVGYLTERLALTVSKVLTIVTLVAWAIHFAMRRIRFRRLPWMYLLPGFWCVAALSLIGSAESKNGTEALFRLATTVVFFFLVVQLLDSVKVLKLCLTLFILVSAVFSSYALVQRFMPQTAFDVRYGWEDKGDRRSGVERNVGTGIMAGVNVERSSGASGHSIMLALNICLVFAPTVVLMANAKRGDVRQLLPLVLLAIFLGTIMATYARTGVVLIAACIVLMVMRRLIRISPAVIMVGFVACCVLAVAAPKSYRDRVLSGEAFSKKEVSIATRLEVLDAAARQYVDHPFLGVGYGNRYGIFDYYTSYPDKEHAVSPHNAYIQVASQTGAFGLSVLMLFFWMAHSRMRKSIAEFAELGRPDMARVGHGLNISVLVFLVSGFAMDLFDKGMPHAWLIIGMCGAYGVLSSEMGEARGGESTVAPDTALR